MWPLGACAEVCFLSGFQLMGTGRKLATIITCKNPVLCTRKASRCQVQEELLFPASIRFRELQQKSLPPEGARHGSHLVQCEPWGGKLLGASEGRRSVAARTNSVQSFCMPLLYLHDDSPSTIFVGALGKTKSTLNSRPPAKQQGPNLDDARRGRASCPGLGRACSLLYLSPE